MVSAAALTWTVCGANLRQTNPKGWAGMSDVVTLDNWKALTIGRCQSFKLLLTIATDVFFKSSVCSRSFSELKLELYLNLEHSPKLTLSFGEFSELNPVWRDFAKPYLELGGRNPSNLEFGENFRLTVHFGEFSEVNLGFGEFSELNFVLGNVAKSHLEFGENSNLTSSLERTPNSRFTLDNFPKWTLGLENSPNLTLFWECCQISPWVWRKLQSNLEFGENSKLTVHSG